MNLLDAMRIYARVVERGGISSAARDLNIGQPAVSERIERLEKHLGCRLLLRNARALTCTPEGRIFYERSKKVLSAVEQAIAEVSHDDRVVTGTIRIAAPHCFGESVLPDALKRVRANYPDLDIDLVLNDRIVDLVTEGVDVSFRLGQLGEGAFIAYPLGRIGRALVAAPEYVEQHGPIAEPGDLVGHPFIRTKDTFGTDQLPLAQSGGIVENAPIRTAIRTSHWRPMHELIAAGVGIGVLETPACVDALGDGRLVRLLPRYDVPGFDLNVLIQAQRPVPPRVRAIVSLLKTCIPAVLGGVRAECV